MLGRSWMPGRGTRSGEVRQMIRVAIVEDEAEIREQLMGYVQRYTRQYGTAFEVKTFADGLEILEDYRPAYDLILLDIEMKHFQMTQTIQMQIIKIAISILQQIIICILIQIILRIT